MIPSPHSTDGTRPDYSPPHDPFRCLTPIDVKALCSRFSLPVPTPDVSLATIVNSSGQTAEGLYDQLATTTDVRLMIAAHAIRCGVRQLPPDPQLKPAKLPPLRHAPAKTPAIVHGKPTLSMNEREEMVTHGSVTGRLTEPKRPRTRVPADHVLTRLAPNPRKRGTETYDRYERYQLGCTVEELVARGVRRGDCIWDLDHQYIEFAPKPPQENSV